MSRLLLVKHVLFLSNWTGPGILMVSHPVYLWVFSCSWISIGMQRIIVEFIFFCGLFSLSIKPLNTKNYPSHICFVLSNTSLQIILPMTSLILWLHNKNQDDDLGHLLQSILHLNFNNNNILIDCVCTSWRCFANCEFAGSSALVASSASHTK